MKYQKGIIQIVLIIGIVAALAVIGYVLYSQKLNSLTNSNLYNPGSMPAQYQGEYKASGQAVAPIKDGSDLNSASASLNSTDITQLDAQLNALNSVSSGF